MSLDSIRPHLPPWVADALESGEGRLASAPEHRRVSVAFVNVTGVDELQSGEGLKAVKDELQKYSVCLMDALEKHHGYLLSSDIATHGFKLILTFGAPVAHEYAAANAARFALEFNQQVQSGAAGRLRHRIGLNGGHVFAGEVGPDFRPQYTVMGDEVNLAARLMASAESGQILASASFLETAGPDFCTKKLDPIKVKGKSEPIPVCLLEGETEEVTTRVSRTTGFTGRAREMKAILLGWEEVLRGRGRVLVIEGEAGVGKTRLLEEALEAMASEAHVITAHSQEHKQGFPLAPWVEVVDGVLGISRHQSVEERTAAVLKWMERDLPESLDVAPLLNPLLAVSFPMTEVVRSLEGQARQKRLFELLERMVIEAAASKPLVIVFEDLHWADDTSVELFRVISRSIPEARVLVLATTRPSDAPLELGSQALQLRLRELTKSEATGMFVSALGVSRLPSEVVETVYAKTRGNPLFLEEVVHALQAPGVLDSILTASSVEVAQSLAALEIPDRVQGLLMSRVDRLPPDSREVAKAASVVGQTFEEEVLRHIEDVDLEKVSLGAALRDLLSSGLAVLERSHNGSPAGSSSRAYRFRHALVQQVAYDSLPFARRQYLHGQIARHLESRADSPDHGLLVHHYRHAGDRLELRDHAVKAAQASSNVYAYREGIDYLDMALGTLTARTAEQACLRSRIEEEIGDYLEAQGKQDEAVRHYVRSRERWKPSAVRQASSCALVEVLPIPDAASRDGELCHKVAAVMERSHGVYGRAVRWLDRAEGVLPCDNDRLACRLKATRSLVYSRMGRYREALELCEESVELAKRSGDTSLETYALIGSFTPCVELGLFAQALRSCRRALLLSEESGDIAAQAKVHGNLGICCHATGDVKGAHTHYEFARSLEMRLGYLPGLVVTENNISELMFMMGRFEEAVEHSNTVIEYCREQGAVGLLGMALTSNARAKLRLGRPEEAATDLEEAEAFLKSAQAEGALADAELVGAELDLAEGRDEAAIERAEQVLLKAQKARGRLTELGALLFLASVRIDRGESDPAEAAIDKALHLAREMDMLYEQGLAQFELARLRAVSGRGAPEKPLAEAIAIFDRMGAEYDQRRAQELSDRLGALPDTVRSEA